MPTPRSGEHAMNVQSTLEELRHGLILSERDADQLNRRMTPAQRLEFSSEMFTFARESLREALRLVHPDWCDEQVKIRLFCLLQGTEGEHPFYFTQYCAYRHNIQSMLNISRHALSPLRDAPL